jgi:hypothetical protein
MVSKGSFHVNLAVRERSIRFYSNACGFIHSGLVTDSLPF